MVILGSNASDWEPYGSFTHPPYLTQTERPRFIQAYYTFAKLMHDDSTKWEERFSAIPVQRLLYVCEIAKLPPRVRSPQGDIECLNAQPGTSSSLSGLDGISLRKRLIQLETEILSYAEEKLRILNGKAPENPWGYALDEGYGQFLVMWDHWQQNLKHTICEHYFSDSPQRFHDLGLWDEG